MIYCYNPKAVGDVLLVITADSSGKEIEYERTGDIARIYMKTEGQTVGWNIFSISKKINLLEGNGQIILSDEQIKELNKEVKNSGFSEELTIDREEKFVIGFVQSCKKHESSDHLSITQIDIGEEKPLQIVCGASNIKAGLKVVVAKVGTMMPDGLLIWSGNLRGVDSQGMICSARELQIETQSQKKGILELPFDAEVGKVFTF